MKWLGIKASKIFEGLLSKLFEILNTILKIPSCGNQAIVVQGFDNWDTLWDTKQELCFFCQTPTAESYSPSLALQKSNAGKSKIIHFYSYPEW